MITFDYMGEGGGLRLRNIWINPRIFFICPICSTVHSFCYQDNTGGQVTTWFIQTIANGHNLVH